MIASEQRGLRDGKSRARRKEETFPAGRRGKMLCISLMICALVLHATFPGLAAAQEASAGEYELKAAVLYNLMQFVEWPSSAYSSSQSPDVVCVLGWDPFGSLLTSMVSDKLVHGRPVQVRHLKDIDRPSACHILYISSSEARRLVQIRSSLKGSSVLTVGEMGQFAARGGIVQFSLYEKRVLLEINLDAANRCGVKISSRLLAIAQIVKEQGKNSSLKDSSTDSQDFESALLRRPKSDSPLAMDSMETAISGNALEERAPDEIYLTGTGIVAAQRIFLASFGG